MYDQMSALSRALGTGCNVAVQTSQIAYLDTAQDCHETEVIINTIRWDGT